MEFNEGEEVAQALKQEDEKVEEGNSVEENERDRKKRALEDVTDANGNRVLQVYRSDITGMKSKMLSRMKKVLNFNILIRRVRRDAETGEEAEDETEDDVEQADIETQVNSSSTNNNSMFSFHSPGVGDPGGQSDRCTVPAGHRGQRGEKEFY